MPRAYYTENWKKIEDGKSNSGENVFLDFCNKCWAKAVENDFEGKIPREIPDQYRTVGDDQDEHPDYAGEKYTCEECNKELTEEDDFHVEPVGSSECTKH